MKATCECVKFPSYLDVTRLQTCSWSTENLQYWMEHDRENFEPARGMMIWPFSVGRNVGQLRYRMLGDKVSYT